MLSLVLRTWRRSYAGLWNPLIMGIIPILTLLCLSAILSVLTVKSIRFRALLCSRPSIVIQDGKILTREMVKNRFTVDELMEELRMAGVTDLSTVKYAVLETTAAFLCCLTLSISRSRSETWG